MLGSQYLFTLSLQHIFVLGFLVLLISEILYFEDLPIFKKKSGLAPSLLGLSIVNFAFLEFSFSEELLLVQLLLGVFYLATYFIKSLAELEENKKTKERIGIYVILMALLVVELID